MNWLNKKIILSFFVIISLGFLAFFVIDKAVKSRLNNLPVISNIAKFELTNFDNQKFTNDQLIGKLYLVAFIFTSCEDACPIMSDHFSVLQKRFYDSDLIQFISITVDPSVDSENVLNDYSKNYSIKDNWFFLTGDLQEIINLAEKGLFLSASLLPAGHSTRFVLVDQNGNVRRYYEGTDKTSIFEIQNDILTLLDD
jgi:protein SCO1/2